MKEQVLTDNVKHGKISATGSSMSDEELDALTEYVSRFGVDAVAGALGDELDGVVAVRGHWVYVRKCEPPEKVVTRNDGSEVTIHIPEKSKDVSNWAKVLAIGVQVGTSRKGTMDKTLRRDRKVPLCIANTLKVGDIVLCAERSEWGLKHSPFSKHEFFMDEDMLIARWEGEQET